MFSGNVVDVINPSHVIADSNAAIELAICVRWLVIPSPVLVNASDVIDVE